jgi:hypothetical protein
MSIARPYFPEFFEFQNSMLILYVTKRHISLTLNNKKFVPAAVIIQKKKSRIVTQILAIV